MATDLHHNGPSPEAVVDAFNDILRHQADLASERGKYMHRAREIHGAIAEAYDAAKDKGITKKVLRARVKHHNLLTRAEACRAALELDEQDEFDTLVEKLGGLAALPLGIAALAAAAPRTNKLDGLTH